MAKKEKKEKRLERHVNEVVLGLLIDDRETDKISEAFGWNDDIFDKTYHTLMAYQNMQFAVEALEQDLPESTKISIFTDFLKSNNFKKIGIKIDSPNDYFMLGYILAISIAEIRLQEAERTGGMSSAMGMNPETIIKFLKGFKKFLEENQE